MKAKRSNRGFIHLEHPQYLEPYTELCLVSESSAIGDYDNSLDNPGSSFLWVGDRHHLNRKEVGELVERLTYWLVNGRLAVDM